MAEGEGRRTEAAGPPGSRQFSSPNTATPRTQLLSNGSYAAMVTAAGSGYSRWRGLALTRWREDVTSDDTGSYIFLRDVESGKRWSAAFQPTGALPQGYHVSFADGCAEFSRRDGTIETRLEIVVSPTDDAEVRRVSVTNHGKAARDIEVTSYAEVVLATAKSDATHPAFSNLFMETECIASRDILLATRRKSLPEDAEIWLAHVVAVDGETVGETEWETSREKFLGRGLRIRAPLAEVDAFKLSGTVGAVLDPIVSLRRRVRVRPGETARVTFTTLAGDSRWGVLDLAEQYRDPHTYPRVAALATTHAESDLRRLGVEPDEAALFQTLAGNILYPDREARDGNEHLLAFNTGGIDALWAHGISGDLPIVLLTADHPEDIHMVRQLLRARAYWLSKCLAADLVIINDCLPTDTHALQTRLEQLIRDKEPTLPPEVAKVQGSTFVIHAAAMTAVQRVVLESVARMTLARRNGTLAQHVGLALRPDAPIAAVARPASTSPAEADAVPSRTPLEFFNGLGGFDAEAGEYVTILREGQWTPAPWINVLANPEFGCLVSESGSGCTWSINSQENLLTEWSNDPVSDPPSDMFYVRDVETGEFWSPTPLPVRDDRGEYVVRHGHGYTHFAHDARGIALELTQFVPVDDPIKISCLALTNHSPATRRISVTAYLEWVLGTSRGESARFVRTEMDADTGAMFAHNAWSADFGTRVAFADLGGAQTTWTGDRTEFIGRNGALDAPAHLTGRTPLSGTTGRTLDPCCAFGTVLDIPAAATVCVLFLLGEAASAEEARALIKKHRSPHIDERLAAVAKQWAGVLGAVQVTTPDRALDLMVNQWLLYQTLASRVWARTAFYQASGAYGFRDQLQDVMALAVTRPDLTRAQIVRAASRQFFEGDVQHWWHEPSGHGMRTRIADDLLWLPYAAHHYLDVTGDTALLDESICFLEGATLAAGQTDAYFAPSVAPEPGTLFEHCARALDRSLAVGVHGLPLMGSGDWNDGMNRVGAAGKGESVWLAWFLHVNLTAWAAIATARGETKRAAAWTNHASAIKDAANRAWDGDWYVRAYFDDGTPLGVAGAGACAIDSIAQSWSVMSGAGDHARSRRAMESVEAQLVRCEDSLVLLLTPPFDHTALEPGYIKGYVPGIRENGGQYTHAAVWSVIALAELGEGDRAWALFRMLNPITHSATPDAMHCYRAEPYVAVGDIYSEAPHVGRGGWSWYTGTAGWLYRAATEWLLGVRVRGDSLIIDPCIPSAWPGFNVALRHGASRYDVTVENPGRVCRGVATIELDDAVCDTKTRVPLCADGAPHRIRVIMAGRP